MNSIVKKVTLGIFISSLLLMLWSYQNGYNSSIPWNVTTSADIIELPIWSMNNGLIEHQIMGDLFLLQERYSGGEAERNFLADQVFLGLCWIGLCLLLALSTAFNRYLFFTIVAGLALFINRLNLFEIGLFGIDSKMVMVIPFLSLLAPLVFFHEYRKDVPLHFRFLTLSAISIALCFGIHDASTFTDHFIAHSLFGFAIICLLFIFLVAEELIFLFLYAVTSTKGGKSNHLHFILLCLIYLGNLTLYYLNKSGIYINSFFFFDPYILLTISALITLWTLRFKDALFSNYIPSNLPLLVLASLGIITFSYFSLSMQRGVETIHQAFHYIIVYSHLGFGFLFFLYVIANFLDPLIKGFEVFKIAYRERNFPYITARLGGLIAALAFFFLSGKEAYKLLSSGYYSYLSVKEKNIGNDLLAREFMINSEYLGFNTHFSNYNLAWTEWKKGNEFKAKSNFFNATQRFPSGFAWVNYGNLEEEENPNKVQAVYEESLRRMRSPEMENNLGIIHLGKNEFSKALTYFQDAGVSEDWNNAPLLNKWNALYRLNSTDSVAMADDFSSGNFGVKSNILATATADDPIDFAFEGLSEAAPLHRYAYLVNSATHFQDNALEQHIRMEMNNTTSSSASQTLANALAIHLYKRGDVNKAFRLFDEMQANTNEFYKGQYLDALGKLALDQGAYRLAEDFFTRAISAGYTTSRISRLEAFAGQNKTDQIASELIKMLEVDPGLTEQANNLLANIETYESKEPKNPIVNVGDLSPEELTSIGQQNAFNETLVLAAVAELGERDSLMSAYEILVEATELNPYSTNLLKNYILSAVDWNLEEYATQSLQRLESLVSTEDFSNFNEEVARRRQAAAEEQWQ